MASAVVGTLRVLLEANAANLEATFSKASITVGDFDRFSKNAIRNLTTTVAQFSGQNIVAEATRMAAAVEKVGGVSVLTAKEIERVSRVTTEATAKLRAIGAEIPPSIAKLHTEIGTLATKSTSSVGAVGGLSGALRALGPILPIASVAGLAAAMIGMGKAALDSADKIVKLSDKTGLSTERIQQFQFVAGQTGGTVEGLAKASFNLGIAIDNGTTKARDAVTRLGLSFEDVKKATPEKQFDMVVKALEGVQSATERNAIAQALFKKSAEDVALAVAGGYTAMKDAAETSTDAQIRALDRAGDEWDKLKGRIAANTIGVLGSMAMVVDGLSQVFEKLGVVDLAKVIGVGILGNQNPVEILVDIGLGLKKAQAQTEAYADALKLMRTHTDTAATSVETYAQRLAAAQVEVKALSSAQRTELNAALKLGGEAAKDYAETIGLSEAALRLYQSGLSVSGKATKDHARETEEAAKAQQRFLDSIKNTTPALTAFFSELKAGVQDSRPEVFLLAEAITDVADAAARAKGIIGDGLMVPLAPAMPGFSGNLNPTGGQPVVPTETGEQFAAWDAQIGKLSKSLSQLATVSGDTFGGIARWLSTVVAAMDAGQQASVALSQGFDQLRVGGIENVIGGLANIVAGGMAAVAAIGQATGQGSTLQRTLGGIATGAKIGSMFGPWGTAIGAVVGGLVGVVRGVFGVSDAVKKARTELEGFQKNLRSTLTDTQKAEAGTEAWKMDVIRVRDAYLATGRTAAEAEAIVRQLWDTDHPERMQAAIEEINRVLVEEKKAAEDVAEAIRLQEEAFADAKEEASGLVDQIFDLADSADGLPKSLIPYIDQLLAVGLITQEQADRLHGLRTAGEVDWEAMQEAAERYGVDLDSLGGRFQGARLHRSAQEIINDFGLLTRGSADVGGVLLGMSDEMGNLVRDSIRLGTTIPANMRPWIQELIRSGHLLDENGNKIENLDKLNFGEELKDEALIAREGFAGIIAKLDELIARITGPLTAALDNITKDRTVNIDVDYRFTEPPIPRDDPTRNVAFSRGGLVTSATRALIGEAGPELVIPLSRLADVVKPFTGSERSSFSPDMRLQPVPIPDFPRGFPGIESRIDDRTGNREAGGDRNVTNVHPLVVLVPQGRDADSIIREIKQGFGQAVALNEFELRTELTSLLMQGAR